MSKIELENNQLPVADRELFEYPISSFDVILSELDNDAGIYFRQVLR